MDERIQRLQRDGAPDSARLHRERLRAGDPYAEAVSRARGLDAFSYRGHQTYACGGQRHEIAAFDHSPTGLVFCLIPGGDFLMGSSGSGSTSPDERPQRSVSVPPFLLAQTPFTGAAWKVDEDKGYLDHRPLVIYDEDPVVDLSWVDTQRVLKRYGLRLPSEAEWEYACRAGTVTEYSFGDDEADLHDYAWFHGNLDAPQPKDRDASDPRPVATKAPNAFGLYDMHGNVFEWCQDTWRESYHKAPTDGSAWFDEPKERHKQEALRQVCRGGCWYYNAHQARSAYRDKDARASHSQSIGFRPARSIPSA